MNALSLVNERVRLAAAYRALFLRAETLPASWPQAMRDDLWAQVHATAARVNELTREVAALAGCAMRSEAP